MISNRDISQPVLVCNVMPLLLPMARSPGVHVSTCIKRIAIRLNRLTPSIEMDTGRMELGSAWEEGLKSRFYRHHGEDRFIDIGEVEYDNLFGTPDLLDTFIPERFKGKGNVIVNEIKCSWISSAHDPKSVPYWKYWSQLESYCYMLGTKLGKLIMVHVKGEYKASSPVQYREWMREFTSFELLSNWSRIHKEAEEMETESRERGFDSVAREMERKAE